MAERIYIYPDGNGKRWHVAAATFATPRAGERAWTCCGRLIRTIAVETKKPTEDVCSSCNRNAPKDGQ